MSVSPHRQTAARAARCLWAAQAWVQLECFPSRSNCLEKFSKKDFFSVSEGVPSWGLEVLSAAIKSNNFDYFFDQYFTGLLEFSRQKDLIFRIIEYKIEQYRDILQSLESVAASPGHWEVLNLFIRIRIESLIGCMNGMKREN